MLKLDDNRKLAIKGMILEEATTYKFKVLYHLCRKPLYSIELSGSFHIRIMVQ